MIIQTGVLPRALGWFGALIAVVLLVGGGTIASTRDVFFVCGFVGFIGFALWDAHRQRLDVPTPEQRNASPLSTA